MHDARRVCLWPRAGSRQPAHPTQDRFRAVVLPHDSAIIQVLRALGRFRQTLRGGLAMGSAYPPPRMAGCHPDRPAVRHDDDPDLQSLRQENARLRELVVRLSSLVIKTIADQK
jgi:hypothetical protein